MRPESFRILMDPNGGDGNGGNPAATPPAPAAPAPPPAPAVSGPVTISPEAFNRYQAIEREYSDLRVQIALSQQAAARKQEELLAENGKVKQALEEREKRLNAELEQERNNFASFRNGVLADKRDAEVAKALTGYKLRDHAATHLIPILGAHFEAVQDPATGKLAVRDKATHQPVESYLKGLMERPEFALYLQPSQGGTGNPQGGQRSSPTPSGNPDPPQSWEDSVFASFNARRQQAFADVAGGIGGFKNPGLNGMRPTN